MASVTLGSSLGGLFSLTDKRKNPNSDVMPVSATLFAASRDNNALDAALTTANAAYYTTARLNNMSRNDKVYALRLLNDAAGI